MKRQTKLIYHKEINKYITDVKWPKGTVAIVGDSIIRELLKTDKHNVKVRFFRRRH